MRIGIIAEGGADIAVITNIIKNLTGLDSNDIVPLRPQLKFDNTHLAHLDPNSHSSWSIVRDECIERKKIEEFLAFEDSTHIVIHIDTAESHLYEVEIPPKNYHDYCYELRTVMINKINDLLNNNYSDVMLYAIAIEETDAWILPLYDKMESCKILNPKKKLQYILRDKKNSFSNYENFLELSKPLLKLKGEEFGKFLQYNCSLRFFCEEIQLKLLN